MTVTRNFSEIQSVNEYEKKTKVKRGRGRKKKNTVISDSWLLYHVNIRNFDARHESLESIVNVHKYNVVMISETHFHGDRKVHVPGYLTYSRNRVDKASGGLATAILNDEAQNVVRVEEGVANNEYIVTRHDQFDTPINIINFYGQQEC